MKFLFVTIDGGGNLHPALTLAQRMRQRGHEVRFLGGSSQQQAIGAAGFHLAHYRAAPDIDLTNRERSPVRDWVDDPETVFAALCDRVWFGPSASFSRDVLDELEREPADALLVDYFVPGALVAAERVGVPTAALWHTTFGEWSALNRGLPALNEARTRLGLPALNDVYQQYRRIPRVLVATFEEFDFAIERPNVPANVIHIGPQFFNPSATGPPRGVRDDPPLVLVSFSTGYQAQEDVLHNVVDALGRLPLRAIVTTGPAIRFENAVPDNVEIAKWRRHSEILPRTSLVITHAGLGTTMAAMAYGVPLLCLPMGRDQHGNAARVEHLGVGTILSDDSEPATIADAMNSMLNTSAYLRRSIEMAKIVRDVIRRDAGIHELEALTSTQRLD